MHLETLLDHSCSGIVLLVFRSGCEHASNSGHNSRNFYVARSAAGIYPPLARHLTPKDSFAIISLGLILVGLAPKLWTMTLGLLVMNCGPGGLLMVRLLLTPFVQHNEVAPMYVVMLVLETAGMSASGPLTAGLFNAGLGKGYGTWLGLPYLVCGLFFAIATAGLCAANLCSEAVPPEGEEGGENSLLHA